MREDLLEVKKEVQAATREAHVGQEGLYLLSVHGCGDGLHLITISPSQIQNSATSLIGFRTSILQPDKPTSLLGSSQGLGNGCCLTPFSRNGTAATKELCGAPAYVSSQSIGTGSVTNNTQPVLARQPWRTARFFKQYMP